MLFKLPCEIQGSGSQPSRIRSSVLKQTHINQHWSLMYKLASGQTKGPSEIQLTESMVMWAKQSTPFWTSTHGSPYSNEMVAMETIQRQESGLESCCSQPETCHFSRESLPQGNTVLGMPGHDGLFLVLLDLWLSRSSFLCYLSQCGPDFDCSCWEIILQGSVTFLPILEGAIGRWI